jgi:hypothetical protein
MPEESTKGDLIFEFKAFKLRTFVCYIVSNLIPTWTCAAGTRVLLATVDVLFVCGVVGGRVVISMDKSM